MAPPPVSAVQHQLIYLLLYLLSIALALWEKACYPLECGGIKTD